VAETLASTVPPLLTLDLSSVEERGALKGHVTVTDAGRSVLAGEVDRVTACGIDKWLGGVHLQSRGTFWRWDDIRQRVSPRHE
jgi:hypothetical protein